MTSIAKNEEKYIEQPILELPEQICWKKTPNFKNGIYGIKSCCDKIAGDDVYGKGRGRYHYKLAFNATASTVVFREATAVSAADKSFRLI